MKDNNEAKRKRVESFLKKNYKGKFIISETPNEDGKFEVSSNGKLTLMSNIEHLTTEDFVFTQVDYFNCCDCTSLKDLEGAPEKARVFECSGCVALKTLEGAPNEAEVFNCSYCTALQSLKGASKKVKEFNCSYCTSLQSLEGAPSVWERFDCTDCNLFMYQQKWNN